MRRADEGECEAWQIDGLATAGRAERVGAKGPEEEGPWWMRHDRGGSFEEREE